MFKTLGAGIIDADIICHDLTREGQPAVTEICQTFGPLVCTSPGKLDRSALRDLVFSDLAAQKALESILHPLVREEIGHAIEKYGAEIPYCILAVPLLIEAGMTDLVDRILVVEAGREDRIQRTLKRGDIDRQMVIQIMNSQLSDQERRRYADDLVVNDRDIDTLQERVLSLDQKYHTLWRNFQRDADRS